MFVITTTKSSNQHSCVRFLATALSFFSKKATFLLFALILSPAVAMALDDWAVDNENGNITSILTQL
jgi:hypothetical protein